VRVVNVQIVKETIVIASDDASSARISCGSVQRGHCLRRRSLKDCETDARQMLSNYDGTQAVDVDELFDDRNVSEMMECHDKVIEIEDDDEWTLMPNHIAAVRSGWLVIITLIQFIWPHMIEM